MDMVLFIILIATAGVISFVIVRRTLRYLRYRRYRRPTHGPRHRTPAVVRPLA